MAEDAPDKPDHLGHRERLRAKFLAQGPDALADYEIIELRAGMFFTIEPMINAGRHEVLILRDEWTAVTRDKSLSAQFEHSIGVTETGYEVFTLSPKGWHKPPYEG